MRVVTSSIVDQFKEIPLLESLLNFQKDSCNICHIPPKCYHFTSWKHGRYAPGFHDIAAAFAVHAKARSHCRGCERCLAERLRSPDAVSRWHMFHLGLELGLNDQTTSHVSLLSRFSWRQSVGVALWCCTLFFAQITYRAEDQFQQPLDERFLLNKPPSLRLFLRDAATRKQDEEEEVSYERGIGERRAVSEHKMPENCLVI